MYNIRNLCRKVRKYGVVLPLSGLLLNYGRWLPVTFQKSLSTYRNRIIRHHLSPIVTRLTKEYLYDTHDEEPGKIWVCWLQGIEDMPDIVGLCIKSIQKNSNGHEVVMLTQHNYKQYVELPGYAEQLYSSRKISAAHFSDILRTHLLAQNGGLWVDATILVTKPLPDSIFQTPFYTVKIPETGYYVSRCRWSTFLMGAHAGNEFITTLAHALDIYYSMHDTVLDYFLLDHLIAMLSDTIPTIGNLIDSVPVNNPSVHELDPMMAKRYDEDNFKRLSLHTQLFKLSWQHHTHQELMKDNTYFHHFSTMFAL